MRRNRNSKSSKKSAVSHLLLETPMFLSLAEASVHCRRVQGPEERTKSTENSPKQTQKEIMVQYCVLRVVRMRMITVVGQLGSQQS